jgi:hypothetical protein
VLNGESAGDFQKIFLRRLAAQFRWANAIDLAFKSEVSRRIGVAAIAMFPALATRLTALTRLPGIPDAERNPGRKSASLG